MSTIDEFYMKNDIYGEVNNISPRNYQSYGNFEYNVDERTYQKPEEPSKIIFLRWVTVVFDILLMGCGLCLFLGRWCFFKVVLGVQFILGTTFIILGSIYLLLGPFGMIGARNHKATLLTMHNIGLLLTVCANTILIFTIYSNEDNHSSQGLIKCDLIRSNVTCNVTSNGEDNKLCCCNLPARTQQCWLNNTLSSQEEKIYCKLHLDEQIRFIKEIGLYLIPISMAIQALAMISGYLVVMCKNRYNRALLKQVYRSELLNR